jgi:hypothetical protein
MNQFLRGLLALVVAMSTSVACAAPARPLPTDSVYQLPAPLTDQEATPPTGARAAAGRSWSRCSTPRASTSAR